jgi:CBS-domain-containing membrane protein
MLKAKDIMATDVVTVSPDTKVTEAAKILLDKRINGVPVVEDNGRVVGILCQSDLISQQKNIPIPSLFTLLDGFISFTSLKSIEKDVEKIAAITVRKAMTPDPVIVHPDTGIDEIATLIVDKNYHSIPVVFRGKLVGIVGKEDILRTIISESERQSPTE